MKFLLIISALALAVSPAVGKVEALDIDCSISNLATETKQVFEVQEVDGSEIQMTDVEGGKVAVTFSPASNSVSVRSESKLSLIFDQYASEVINPSPDSKFVFKIPPALSIECSVQN